jgi:RNA polymerase sigma factor (sigma-70 family)
MPFPRNKIFKGHSVPYGSMAGISLETRTCYYTHGYKNDHDLPDLPDVSTVMEEEIDPEAELYAKELNALLHEALANLSPRQAKVLCLRFGIGINFERTQSEVGVVLNITSERIRQIEVAAIRNIRKPFIEIYKIMEVQ